MIKCQNYLFISIFNLCHTAQGMVRCFFQHRNFPWPGKGKNKYFSWDESITGALFPAFSQIEMDA